MATIETIRRIRVQQISEGADAVRRDLLATADAQRQLGESSGAVAVVTDLASKRQLSASAAYQKAAAQLDATVRASNQYERILRALDRALGQNVIGISEYDQRLTQLQQKYGALTSATDEFAAAQKRAVQQSVNKQTIVPNREGDIAAYGAALDALRSKFNPLFAAEQQFEQQVDSINRAVRVGAISEKERTGAIATARATLLNQTNEIRKAEEANSRLTKGVGLNAYAWQNLGYQVNDVVTSLASGISPMQTLAQQGGQIYQILESGQGGVGGALAGIRDRVLEIATPARVTFAAIATGLVAAAASALSYNNTQDALLKNVSGIGRASGVTVGQINALAPAAAAAGNVSVRSAREMAGEFAATGKIGVAMYADLIGTAKNYAATTGQEMPAATKALAAAFADPAKGADTLNEQLGFLNDRTRENVQRLAAQGDRLGAQRALFTAYKTSLTDATELTSAWGRAMSAVGVVISNTWDKVGQVIDRVVTGGDLETQLATAQKVLSASQSRQGLLPFGIGSRDTALAQAEVARLQNDLNRRAAASDLTRANQRSLEIGAIVRGLSPAEEQIKAIEDRAANIRNYFRENWVDPYGAAVRAMEGLRTQAKQLREDLLAGGAAFADSIRNAQFGQRTVGFTPQGLSAAQIEKEAEDRGRAVLRDGGAQDDINARLQSIELERVTRLQTLQQQTTLDLNTVGGAFSRMSQTVQQQINAAATASGRIPASIIAGIAQVESAGNPNIGFSKVVGEDGRRSTAYGLGQINAPTAAAAIRGGYLPRDYDRMDPNRGAEGIAGVLEMKRVQNGGTIEAAIKAYFGSRDDSANNAYLAKVMRASGQMGDPSIGAQARAQDEATRAARDSAQALQNVTQNYGKNGLALEANAEAQRRYNALLDAGVPANDALAASIKGIATQAATAAQQAKLVQFASDVGFDREQLGRTQLEQGAYARARSYVGDTSSREAQFVIDQSRTNAGLLETKATMTDALGSLASDLRRGASAAEAFSNVLGRIADRALNGLTDSLVSGLFKMGGSGGGDLFGGIGKLFGFAEGGFTGYGGKYEPAGIVHRGEYVIDAGTVGRIGRGFFDGLRGYADGGFVDMPDMRRAPVSSVPAANSNAAGPVQVNHNPTYTITPANGVTPEQLAAVVDRNNRDFANRLPELIQTAQRRRAA